MNGPGDEADGVDELVLAHLTRQARREDAEAGLARVRAALARPPSAPGPTVGRSRARLGLAAGVAATLALALLSGGLLAPVRASSRDLVQQTRRVHQQALERCYSVEVRRIADWRGRPALGRAPRQVRVWTRGDRFRVEMTHADTETSFTWGREKDGSLWAALEPDRGVRVSAEQAPPLLTLLADVYSLNVDTLLDTVLHDCTISEDPVPPGSKTTRVVRAEAHSRRTRLWLRHATLEIDDGVLSRLVLARNRLGVPFAEVVYRLVETRPAAEAGAGYRLEDHLRRPFRIHEGGGEPAVKRELLARWLGVRSGLKAKANEDRARVVFDDVTGQRQTPLWQPKQKATVLFFLLPDCPISNAYAPEIERIGTDYRTKQVAAFVVHADPDVTALAARKHAKEYGLSCPVLLDPTHVLVGRTGVSKAPEVAVLDPAGKVVYRGRIDDWYADYGKRRGEPSRRDLREALDALLAGKPVARETTLAVGCDLPEPKK